MNQVVRSSRDLPCNNSESNLHPPPPSFFNLDPVARTKWSKKIRTASGAARDRKIVHFAFICLCPQQQQCRELWSWYNFSLSIDDKSEVHARIADLSSREGEKKCANANFNVRVLCCSILRSEHSCEFIIDYINICISVCIIQNK